MTMYRTLVRTIALVLIVMGIAMLTVTLRHGFGVGVILGLLFIGAGVGRLLMLRRKAP
ncbi:MAG TPA: hypothetical protein VNH45_03530 [Gaiellaceae bacterium]|jgi:hypothetical protein|nr:hypothetical protein [Gaiellaceae bacterium]